jgi:hypothetical protein
MRFVPSSSDGWSCLQAQELNISTIRCIQWKGVDAKTRTNQASGAHPTTADLLRTVTCFFGSLDASWLRGDLNLRAKSLIFGRTIKVDHWLALVSL